MDAGFVTRSQHPHPQTRLSPLSPGAVHYTVSCKTHGRRFLFMLGIKLNPRQFLDRVAQELARINPAEVQALADAVHDVYRNARTVFLMGNGGSGSNASH